MKPASFLLISVCLLFVNYSSHAKDRFSKEVKRAIGDLNKDGLEDLVIVTEDTTSEDWPYRLQVFFKQPDNKYRLEVSTEQAIDSKYPGARDGNDFDDISITNGVLTISVQLLRGHYEHKFRYQNGNFELIGFSEAGSDGQGTCSTVDFNLSTGMRLERDERCDIDKVIRNMKKKVMIRPLPKLQDFKPMESELY